MVGIDKEFDYLIPPAWIDDGRADQVVVGTMVRIRLAGRRVAGWVSAVDVEPEPGVSLVPLAKLSGVGPDAEMLALASWGAWRWAGRRVALLRAASPPRMVAGVGPPRRRRPVPSGPNDVFDRAFTHGLAVVRTPPSDDGVPLALAACRLGDSLLITPDAGRARHLAIALRRAGVEVALGHDEWTRAASGGTVVGTRSAAWMPVPHLAAVVVFDEHDEALQEERTPTWHARAVALERARRREIPAVLASPVPSLDALHAAPLLRPERAAERAAWPVVHVLDRREDDPVRAGLFAEHLTRHLRGDGRVICVLNRTGRARLLACGSCGEIVRSEDERVPMALVDEEGQRVLRAVDGSETRPVVCAHCGSTTLRNLRAGVTRAREELAALVGERVEEVTASTTAVPESRIVIGTEAVLHRVDRAEAVVFLDLDQELLAPRQRAKEQAMALLARAARLLGPRAEGGRLVLQTRQPAHEVIQAALRGDPSLVAVAERDRRRALGQPPYGAQALVSGAGAEQFVDALGRPAGVTVRGPDGGQWLLRADEHPPLLDALAATPRPAARVRIEVDPLRV